MKLILIVAGVICLFLAAFNVTHPRVDFYRLGWAFLAAGVLLPIGG